MSSIQRWTLTGDGLILSDDQGRFVDYTDHKKIVDRVCRYRRKDRPTGDLSPRYWVSENCGRIEMYKPDHGYYCRSCGGKIEVM